MAQRRVPGFLQLAHEVRLRIANSLAFADRFAGRATLQKPARPRLAGGNQVTFAGDFLLHGRVQSP